MSPQIYKYSTCTCMYIYVRVRSEVRHVLGETLECKNSYTHRERGLQLFIHSVMSVESLRHTAAEKI